MFAYMKHSAFQQVVSRSDRHAWALMFKRRGEELVMLSLNEVWGRRRSGRAEESQRLYRSTVRRERQRDVDRLSRVDLREST